MAECLVKMGARIEGIHTTSLKVRGVTSLHGTEHSVIPDRIETGTYAMCAGMTGGTAYLLVTGAVGALLNADTVAAEPVSPGDDEVLHELLRAHLDATGSAGAQAILCGRLSPPPRFVKVRALGL